LKLFDRKIDAGLEHWYESLVEPIIQTHELCPGPLSRDLIVRQHWKRRERSDALAYPAERRRIRGAESERE
jgi:hypothetical protein